MDIRLIAEQYGFKVNSSEEIKSICRLETENGTKCLKKAHMSPEYFMFINSAINYLIDRGFKGVVPYVPTADGRPCIQDGKYVYYVTEWIDSRECKFKVPEDLKKAIRTAAELHKASEGYVPPAGSNPRVYYSKWPEKFEHKCIQLLEFSKSIEEKEYIDDFDEIYAKYLYYYWQQGKKSIEMLKASPYFEISRLSAEKGEICHHDMANHNFLITYDNRVFLIDFDYCIMDTRLHDISSLVIRNMRYGIWDIEKANFILEQYDRVYPISSKELQVIKAFMTFPQDFWQIGLQYYVEKQPWTMVYFLTRLNRIVDDKDIREKFLEDFLKL